MHVQAHVVWQCRKYCVIHLHADNNFMNFINILMHNWNHLSPCLVKLQSEAMWMDLQMPACQDRCWMTSTLFLATTAIDYGPCKARCRHLAGGACALATHPWMSWLVSCRRPSASAPGRGPRFLCLLPAPRMWLPRCNRELPETVHES